MVGVLHECFFLSTKENSGPLVDVYFFNMSLLKGCTLHILNLGLMGVSNGSTLQLG